MRKALRYLSIPAFALSTMFLFGPVAYADHLATTVKECAEAYNTRKDDSTVSDEENRMRFEACKERVKALKKGNS